MIGGARKKEKKKEKTAALLRCSGGEGRGEGKGGMAHLEEKESGADRGARGLADAPCIAV